MSQKNDTPAVIASLLITLALLGAGGWWLWTQFNSRGGTPVGINSPGNSSGIPGVNGNSAVQERGSGGQRILVSEGASVAKQAGAEAMTNMRFEEAIANFEASLEANPNDPEALIYLNNARAELQWTTNGSGSRVDMTAIAVVVPIDDSLNPSLEILRGVAQAQNEINRVGGIKGTLLKVVIVNDAAEPDTVEQIATGLVNSGVLGVVGHFGSDATLAAAAVYQANGLVMVSPTSTSTTISELGDYIFRTVPSDRFTATALSRHMLNAMQRSRAVVYFNSESAYSNSLKNEFATALATDGGQVLNEFDLASPNFNAAATLAQANQQGAEVLVMLANTATLDPALQVVGQNQNQLAVLGGDSLYNPKTLEVGGAAAEGMVVAVPWVLLSNPQSSFVKTARELWGGDVNWRTAMAYDAVQVLIQGMQAGREREAIKNALNSDIFEVEGATGTIRFLPSGDRNQPMQLVTIQPGTRSGYGYDFVPVP
ncbi:amino acid ABC transporter substrate-binding protein [Oscillatoria sp. FACHB-1407]|uniref:ABC transporter substrate-binding protein n=1 Tax=Oscillatoria sp. FACHB-1407 TaxID=2692847 RepID=UPI001689D17A|nr:ABC transporter substrate-binding protein [Oscillatoria sp. FACHB-1407]MBD2460978.1 amino acid ABC transporter substrate-binding protein [Oscillatoria sp. FACHB-1407]